MKSTVERFDEWARTRVGALGRTIIHDGELLRHPLYTRLVHWIAATFFILALVSGFALYSPWLFRALTPVFGGGPLTRALHPWFSLGFVISFLFQVLNWIAPMRWTDADTRWLQHFREYVTNAAKLEPEDTGFFNAGQKGYFWAIVGSVVAFLLSGIPMWFPETFGRGLVSIGLVVHDIAALVMLAGLVAHVYESTAQQPGTFGAMVRGTVSTRWGWTHHPGWYRQATGRDPRADYERALREQERDGSSSR
jgi:formate dehydrogenase subunit gamma